MIQISFHYCRKTQTAMTNQFFWCIQIDFSNWGLLLHTFECGLMPDVIAIDRISKCHFFVVHLQRGRQRQHQVQSHKGASEGLSRIHAAASRVVWNTTHRTVGGRSRWNVLSALRLDRVIVWKVRWWISISNDSMLESRSFRATDATATHAGDGWWCLDTRM